MNILKQVLAGLALVLAFGTASAQGMGDPKARGYTKGEWALLPEWCIDSQDGPYGAPEGGSYVNKSPRAGKWVGLMGGDFWHMHHYCRALRDVRRAQAATISKRDRDFVLARALGDFDYVLQNCQPNMALMPEVYLRLGEMFVMQNKLAEAGNAFDQSRKLKPDYWPAYDRWIQVLLDLKQYDSARRMAQEGLAHAPGQPSLVARLKTIDERSGQRTTPAAP